MTGSRLYPKELVSIEHCPIQSNRNRPDLSSNLHQLPFEFHRIVGEAPARRSKVEMTIGLDLGDVWSHYCTLNEEGEVIDQGRFRTSPKGVEKWFKRLTETEYTETQALIKVYGVGQLTALTNVLTLGSKERFHRSRDVGCYLARAFGYFEASVRHTAHQTTVRLHRSRSKGLFACSTAKRGKQCREEYSWHYTYSPELSTAT
ncbi:hypothetical protein [Tunturiibacter gelidoferens]|uniref:Uncharacterized protein n=1 Tax=Tunturiibacter gelidiferens TaxID=3069689 RepID=A0ACC5P3S5_9BACT|nr:hypothetical protein [Edaphobacter lichenicola]MBB5341524.1 hypothetical protein [Edaphobacter lichenicola]